MRPDLYKRPNKPLSIPVKSRRGFDSLEVVELAAPVIVDKFTECHVTPSDVAARMISYLGPQGDYLTLEPSAGTGQLTKALLASGHSQYELTQVERHIKLANELQKLGPTINRCFLEWSTEAAGKVEFPRVVMNPPFKDVRKHIKAALALLGRGGHTEPATLVALVPLTYSHPDAETLEELPADTFSTAKVYPKIIRIRR